MAASVRRAERDEGRNRDKEDDTDVELRDSSGW